MSSRPQLDRPDGQIGPIFVDRTHRLRRSTAPFFTVVATVLSALFLAISRPFDDAEVWPGNLAVELTLFFLAPTLWLLAVAFAITELITGRRTVAIACLVVLAVPFLLFVIPLVAQRS